jgi:divalent metal cation (Fe/Co/Zn/Cd) transporter
LYFIAGNKPGKIIVAITLIAITLMGCTIFFEIFGHHMKQFLYESRMNGFGTLLFIIVYVFWLARAKPIKLETKTITTN